MPPGKLFLLPLTTILAENTNRCFTGHSSSLDVLPKEQLITNNTHAIASLGTLTALASLLMRSDSPPNLQEITCFQKIFTTDTAFPKQASELFEAANQSLLDIHTYIQQLRILFPLSDQGFYEQLMALFVFIALADGSLHIKEAQWLKEFARSFDLDPQILITILKSFLLPISLEPEEILGLKKGYSPINLKQSYHEQVQYCHPDRLQKETISEEYRLVMTEKFTLIQHAYEQLKAPSKYSFFSRKKRSY